MMLYPGTLIDVVVRKKLAMKKISMLSVHG